MNLHNQVKEWKNDSGHSYREMGRRIGTCNNHVFNGNIGKKGFSDRLIFRFKEVRRLENLSESSNENGKIYNEAIELFISGNKRLKNN